MDFLVSTKIPLYITLLNKIPSVRRHCVFTERQLFCKNELRKLKYYLTDTNRKFKIHRIDK